MTEFSCLYLPSSTDEYVSFISDTVKLCFIGLERMMCLQRSPVLGLIEIHCIKMSAIQKKALPVPL